MIDSFQGYVSSADKTNIASNIYVRGSRNVYKKISGTVATRQGQKRQGIADSTYSAVSSEFVWYTSWGETLPVWITKSSLQVRYNGIWYDLLTGLAKTRYVFDKWYNPLEAKDLLLFVNGTGNLYWWSGGIATIASGTAPAAGGVTAYSIHTAGTTYGLNDIVTLTGGGGTGATFKITAVAIGVPTALQQLTTGSGYSTGSNLATTGSATGSGLTLDVTAVGTVGTLTKQNPSVSWAQAGFSSDPLNQGVKRIMIAGTEYSYTGGEATATLIGVTPDPSGIPAGTLALQSVITEIPALPIAASALDFLKVINNQVYIGSYTSRLVYISSSQAFLNYTVPTPRTAGTPELITLDSTGKGIGVRQGQAHVGFGTSSWAVITFSDITVGSTLTQKTSVSVKPVANLQAPYAHEFIANVGDNIVYLGQDQQLRSFGEFNNLFTPAYPSFSQEIQTELEEENFTGGGLSCIGEFTYLTAPVSGKVYLYQVRQLVDSAGNVVAERLWHAPFIWNATRVDEIDGTVVAFSNANPQVYEVWDTNQWYDDSPSGEELPYECVLAFSYRSPRRQGLVSFDKNYSEGYISEGTPLNVSIYYNYQGSAAVLSAPVNSISRPAYTFAGTTAPSLGDNSLGDDSLGNGLSTSFDAQDQLPKFKVINSLNMTNCFEYQVVYSSNATNAQWELLATATNQVLEQNQQATFLVNKLRI